MNSNKPAVKNEGATYIAITVLGVFNTVIDWYDLPQMITQWYLG